MKEVFEQIPEKMATCTVSRAEKLKGWFVMIEGTVRADYADNKLWGDGWGWLVVCVPNPAKTTSTDYRTDCQPCHVPARNADWVCRADTRR